MNRKLKNIKLGTAAMEVLLHLRDGEANGSLRSNTSAMEESGYALGEGAVAVGTETKAIGKNSFAEGTGTTASNEQAHAEGYETVASEWCAHAGGQGSTASGICSHAVGYGAVASEWCAHAEAQATASGTCSHAEGYLTEASGSDAHAEGQGTTASGYRSHAGGRSTIAQRADQTAIGSFNTADTSGTVSTRGAYVFIIGKGTSATARSNALTVAWNGNTAISGTLTQSSDRRLKDHRNYLGAKSLEFIRKLKPAYFFKDQEPHVGLYAQDIEGIDPYRTILGEMNGFETVNYTELIPHLITYCQHLEQRIEELERR